MKATNLINFANIVPGIASTKTVDNNYIAAPTNTANHADPIHSHSKDLNYPNYFDTASLAYHIMGFGKF
ncbi:MAG: hypothetical protein V7K77_09680 [Nostoc sp.]|uniref:hypothetical protein n=1 Tax=Nostoc sp. TaxID=1180 RepID=UPI002FFBB8FD